MATRNTGERELVHPRSRAEWRRWLLKNHLTSPGCLLVTWRKETGKPRVEYDEAVEELLCFGWIDSKAGKLDADRSTLLCTPRKPRSGWSRPNKERIARLLAAGLMAPRGIEVVEAAKASGRWDALNDVEDGVIPPDLASAFRRHAGSRKNFEAFPRSVRRGILEWITQAKKPETRARRIEETASLAARNVRANQWTPPGAPPRR